MIAKVLGYKARFCGPACKEGFQCDRENGMNYGLHALNNVLCMHREEWSLASRCCAYCGEEVEDGLPIPEALIVKFHIEPEHDQREEDEKMYQQELSRQLSKFR